MDSIKIGKKLKQLRGKRTLKEVAKSIGVSTSAMAMYERGERIPRDEIKIAISKFYDVAITDIFFI